MAETGLLGGGIVQADGGPDTAQILIAMDVTKESSSHHVEHVNQTAQLWLQAVYGPRKEAIKKARDGALGVEAPSDKPHRTAQRRPGVVSLVMWAKPPAADARSQGGRGAKVRDMRGREEGNEREVGGSISRVKQAGCLLPAIVLGMWPDEGQPSAPM